MGKDTKVVAHEDMDTGTGIFYKCGYGDGHSSTLSIGYPLPSLTIVYQIFSHLFPYIIKLSISRKEKLKKFYNHWNVKKKLYHGENILVVEFQIKSLNVIISSYDVLNLGTRCLLFSFLFFGLLSELDVLYFVMIHMHPLFCNDTYALYVLYYAISMFVQVKML